MISRVFPKPATAYDPTPCVDPGARVYAIGDVHGRYDLLIALLKKIHHDANGRADHRAVRIIILGNVIDLGEHGAQVLKLLEELASSTKGGVLCLKGSHEAALLRFINDPLGGRTWLKHGAATTLRGFGLALPSRHAPQTKILALANQLKFSLGSLFGFLKGLPLYCRSGDVIFSHAGVNPQPKMVIDDAQAMLRGHADFLVPDPVPGLRFVHGHYVHLVPVLHPGRICIDTGAYHNGVLTAVRLDDEIGFLSADNTSLAL